MEKKTGHGDWKNCDSLTCFPVKGDKFKCSIKSGLVHRDLGILNEVRFSNVPDVAIRDGVLELIPTIHDTEYKITEYDRRYLNVRRK